MDRLDWIQLIGQVVAVLFVMAFGACIGSLLNVLVYRLPLGLDVVTPTSRCPSCETYLTWRENIPVFGWLLLRGKCRFCRSPISPEYPLVEGYVALLWAVVFLMLYADGGKFLGLDFSAFQPEWARAGIVTTWPIFLVVLCLFSNLVAMTLVDAKTCFIPMPLTTVPVVFAVIVHPIAAWWIEHKRGRLPFAAEGWTWAIATPGPHSWWWIGASIGGVVGLVLAYALLRFKLIRRSFEDYEAWEKAELAKAAASPTEAASGEASPAVPASTTETVTAPPPPAEEPPPAPPSPAVQMALRLLVIAMVLGTVGYLWYRQSWAVGDVLSWGVIVVFPILGLWALMHVGSQSQTEPPELWIQYPHARREMLKELLYLAPAISLAMAGGALALRVAGSEATGGATAPLWLMALSGVLLGYLIGGGIVWATRIFGSLGFGKEAMGLGDVHMMAAVGACIGWTDAVLGFFGAAIVGVMLALLGTVFSGKFRKAMPFGPSLALGTMLVWFAKPAFEAFLSFLFKAEVNLP